MIANKTKHSFFYYLFSLTSVIIMLLLTGCFDVKINGESYSRDIVSFTVTDKIEDYSVFNKFKQLKTLDLTAVDLSLSEYDNISAQLENQVDILWNVPVGNEKVSNKVAELEITPELNITDVSFFNYLPNLNSLTISSIKSSPFLHDIVNAAKAVNPDIAIKCSTSVYGVDIDNDTEFLDLNTIPIDDLTELDVALGIFPNIKTVEICSCTLDNETIAALRDKYPDKKIVWLIKVSRFSIRTDAQVFSTLGKMKYYDFTSEVASPIFKYCTELRALDLGHNNLTDISEITNLKHLHTLILADNAISDISPLAELKDLNYIELQANKIKDAAPLGELPLLEDLYIVKNSKIQNIVSVGKCTKIHKLYISSCGITGNEIWELKKVIPKDCEFRYGQHYYWRGDEKNTYIRRAFSNWKKVKEFPEWRNIVFSDTDLYAFMQK